MAILSNTVEIYLGFKMYALKRNIEYQYIIQPLHYTRPFIILM